MTTYIYTSAHISVLYTSYTNAKFNDSQWWQWKFVFAAVEKDEKNWKDHQLKWARCSLRLQSVWSRLFCRNFVFFVCVWRWVPASLLTVVGSGNAVCWATGQITRCSSTWSKSEKCALQHQRIRILSGKTALALHWQCFANSLLPGLAKSNEQIQCCSKRYIYLWQITSTPSNTICSVPRSRWARGTASFGVARPFLTRSSFSGKVRLVNGFDGKSANQFHFFSSFSHCGLREPLLIQHDIFPLCSSLKKKYASTG